MGDSAVRYRAFISYSQRDKTIARRLQRRLESYRIPKGVEAAVGADRRLGRLFRDDEELGAAADLGATLRAAIEDAESLIVVCSPHAARSRWVDAEIEHFRKTGRGDRIFAVIVAGTPNAPDPEAECLPPSLRASALAGAVEPLALDVRKEPSARLKARLAAGLLGVSFDQLWRRDRRRARARSAGLAAVAAAGLVVLAAGAAALRFVQLRQQEAERHTTFADAAQRALDASNPALAARLILAMARPTPWSPPLSTDAHLTLRLASERLTGLPEFLGHRGPVETITFSPDGVWLATTSEDRTARIWEAATGRQIAVLEHEDTPQGAVFTEDGKELVTSTGGRLHVWRAGDGSHAGEFDIEGFLGSLAWARREADGTLTLGGGGYLPTRAGDVAASNQRGIVGLWSAHAGGAGPLAGRHVATSVGSHCVQGRERCVFRPTRTTLAVATFSQEAPTPLFEPAVGPYLFEAALSRDGSLLAFDNGDMNIWRLDPDPTELVVSDEIASVSFLAFSLRGDFVAYVDDDDSFARNSVFLWRWSENAPAPIRLARDLGRTITSLAVSPDGQMIVTGDEAGRVIAVPTRIAKDLDNPQPVAGVTLEAAFSPDGTRFVLAPEEGGLELYDSATGTALAVSLSEAEVYHLAFSPDGTKIAGLANGAWSAGDPENALIVFDARTLERLATRAPPHAEGVDASDSFEAFSFSEDSERVAAGTFGGAIHVFRTSDWQVERTLILPERADHDDVRAVRGLVYINDGQRLIAGYEGGPSLIWTLETGTHLAVEGDIPGVRFLASPDDSKVVALSRENAISVIDIATAKAVFESDRDYSGAAVDTIRMRAAVGDYDHVKILDLANGKEVRRLALDGYDRSLDPEHLAFSADGRLLAVSGSYGDIVLFDVETGEEQALATSEGVGGLVFNADGSALLIAGYDWATPAPTYLWNMSRIRGGDIAVTQLWQDLCASGGALHGAMRRLSTGDISYAPALAGRLGENVCEPDGDWFAQFFGLSS